ncbi:hypothetical protein HGRIS_007457 [Hohenbuehelia grisea]
MWHPPLPLSNASFTLDVSGIAGFFGGEEAISAMASVHIYKGRKTLGLYNSPGSYTVAKKYGQLARSRIWDGLYPGVNVEPAVMLELDGTNGPKYHGVVSGTVIDNTGHVGHLLETYCSNRLADLRPVEVTGRQARFEEAIIVHLERPAVDPPELTLPSPYTPLMAFAVISSNFATCITAAIYGEWLAFAMILLGIICNGWACWVIGSGELAYERPKSAESSPPGDGFMLTEGRVIILKGRENAINSITRGKFLLRYKSAQKYHDIGISALALTAQFLLQLFLIPQANLFGQILFLTSLAVSYAYNAFLSSIDKEKSQQDILLRQLEALRPQKFKFTNRTAMGIFTLLAAFPKDILKNGSANERDLRMDVALRTLLPNETPVWDAWGRIVFRELRRLFHEQQIPNTEKLQAEEDDIFSASKQDDDGLDEKEKELLNTLLQDARDG